MNGLPLALLSTWLVACAGPAGTPRAVDGVLDLTTWDLERDGRVKLKGEWDFYPNQLLAPHALDDGMRVTAVVPSSWRETEVDGAPLPGTGFATYHLRIRLPPDTGELGLLLPEQGTAWQAWVDDERLAASGTVGIDASTSVPQYLSMVRTFHPSDETVDLVFQVSNFHHRAGGLWGTVELGSAREVTFADSVRAGLDVFACGALVIMGLYHLVLFAFRPKDPSTLAFGLLCLGMAVRVLLTGQKVAARALPDLDWAWSVRAEYLTVYFIGPAFLWFVRAVLGAIPRWLATGYTAVAAVYALVALVTPPLLFTYTIASFQFLTLPIFAFLLAVAVRATVRRQDGAGLLLMGLLVIVAAFVNDSLHSQDHIHTGYYAAGGILAFCFVQSAMLSIRFMRAFAAVERLSEELSRMDQLKDAFLANTSHELRTPIHGIVGLAESVLDGAAGTVSEAVRRNLALIVQSGHRLSALVNDILDFSKMKHQELALDPVSVDLRSTVELVLALSRPLVGSKPVALLDAVPDALPPVRADENRLEQILVNLVGNAVKFTHEGRVEVGAAVDGERVQVTVTDTGIGIPADRRERIFNAFEQGDGSIARQYGGAGLGLAVTRSLVQMHGGTLSVESEVGRGSTFTFTLPRATGADPVRIARVGVVRGVEARVEEIPSAPGLALRSRGTILVVDDEPVNVQVLQNHLQVAGFAVETARDGFEALDLLARRTPDLVLLDLMMPRMNGYEVARRIRERPELAALPILILTARNQLDDLVQGFQSGANDYLVKPFQRQELLSRIEAHLSLYQVNCALGRFVPTAFLRILRRRSITEVGLGDNVGLPLTVLFSDIRSFTAMSERLGPDDTFRFVNGYLNQMAPVISRNDGFIDKYIGDAIMALFDGCPDDAIRAGVEMIRALEAYNEGRQRAGYPPVAIGVGIHHGPVMLGTVGEPHRMDSTVIGDAVNLASRVEGLTKTYGTPILVTEQARGHLVDPTRFALRRVDRVTVRGKTQPVDIWEVLDGVPGHRREAILSRLDLFHEGLGRWFAGDRAGARAAFLPCRDACPEDPVARLYLERCDGAG